MEALKTIGPFKIKLHEISALQQRRIHIITIVYERTLINKYIKHTLQYNNLVLMKQIDNKNHHSLMGTSMLNLIKYRYSKATVYLKTIEASTHRGACYSTYITTNDKRHNQ